MKTAILVLNAGSSSIKFALYPAMETDGGRVLYAGEIEGIGHVARLSVTDADGKTVAERPVKGKATHHVALSVLLDWISKHSGGIVLAAAGHRVAHGGSEFVAPVMITPTVREKLESLNPLAPLHQPYNLAAITALSTLHPKLPQVACFDTAFHATEPDVATRIALPRQLTDKGIRRYGFHGLSYEYIASVLPGHLGDGADGRIVVAHLGSGASMCAMRERRSVATTMGFSPLDGLVMGTRCGSLDPGVVLYLLDHEGMSSADVTHLLYEKSGLLGVSGVSDDMRDLLASDDPNAAEALELFVYRIVRELGSLAAALGGLDALVFTGGIGEHATEIRARVCRQAAWLGIDPDEAANRRGGPRIDRGDSDVSVLVLATDEQLVIARHTRALISGATRHPAARRG